MLNCKIVHPEQAKNLARVARRVEETLQGQKVNFLGRDLIHMRTLVHSERKAVGNTSVGSRYTDVNTFDQIVQKVIKVSQGPSPLGKTVVFTEHDAAFLREFSDAVFAHLRATNNLPKSSWRKMRAQIKVRKLAYKTDKAKSAPAKIKSRPLEDECPLPTLVGPYCSIVRIKAYQN